MQKLRLGWNGRMGGCRGMLVLFTLLLCFTGSWAPEASGTKTILAKMTFLQVHPLAYWVEWDEEGSQDAWVKAWPVESEGLAFSQQEACFLGSGVVLEFRNAFASEGLELVWLARYDMGSGVTRYSDRVWLVNFASAQKAILSAEEWCRDPLVRSCYPLTRKPSYRDEAYASYPNDPFFFGQWPLERPFTDQGIRTGPDLNLRSAWPITRGQGVTVAVVDTGVEMDHPDLAPRLAGAPHYHFHHDHFLAVPPSGSATAAHGTMVSGLIAAEGLNGKGMIGVAPAARLASWSIFDDALNLTSEDRLAKMYVYRMQEVGVQNHSWGSDRVGLNGPGPLEQVALERALVEGREGKGVVMVRSAGNRRDTGGNANDDGYPSHPGVIGVGGFGFDGRVTGSSEPGASLLVAGPSAHQGAPGLFTTDLLGSRGQNPILFMGQPELSDYVFDSLGFRGTSASTALISGVCALVLSANPELTVRDVQQILLLSSRHFDWEDPDLVFNGAGLPVSHSLGFGVPDAGQAVRMAKSWRSRPERLEKRIEVSEAKSIPDGGLRLEFMGVSVPLELNAVRLIPGLGVFPEEGTEWVSGVDIGLAANPLGVDLTGKMALIQRGGPSSLTFAQKIGNAAAAGAVFAVVYNNAEGNLNCSGGDTLCGLGGTFQVSIPSVFVVQTDGERIRDWFAGHPEGRVRLAYETVSYSFLMEESWMTEHVGVRIRTTHPRRGDLRIVLNSPSGTRSVLQAFSVDTQPGPVDWTYYSTHHFFESSVGEWRVEVGDQRLNGESGEVTAIELWISGVSIEDSDRDGLEDSWERTWFEDLTRYGPGDDVDGDGETNLLESLMDTNPLRRNHPFRLDLMAWSPEYLRVSWPGTDEEEYEIWSASELGGEWQMKATVSGKFPSTEWRGAVSSEQSEWIQVRRKALSEEQE